jgi:hypothetical protein
MIERVLKPGWLWNNLNLIGDKNEQNSIGKNGPECTGTEY